MHTCSTTDEVELALDLVPGELYVIDPPLTDRAQYQITYFMYLGAVEAYGVNVHNVKYKYKFLRGDEVVDLFLFKGDGDVFKRVSK